MKLQFKHTPTGWTRGICSLSSCATQATHTPATQKRCVRLVRPGRSAKAMTMQLRPTKQPNNLHIKLPHQDFPLEEALKSRFWPWSKTNCTVKGRKKVAINMHFYALEKFKFTKAAD